MNPTMLPDPAWAEVLPDFLNLSPATGDPVIVIAAVLGVSAVAMIVLSVLSKRGKKGGRRR